MQSTTETASRTETTVSSHEMQTGLLTGEISFHDKDAGEFKKMWGIYQYNKGNVQ